MMIRCAFFVVFFCFLFSACGVSNIVNRGECIDHQSIGQGSPRKDLLARFGAPIDTKKNEQGIVTDIFRVPQGETTTGKVVKAGGLLVLDILTLGLTEIIATPVTDGKNYIVLEVNYDKDERVQTFKFINQ